jgi:hypothetical protein
MVDAINKWLNHPIACHLAVLLCVVDASPDMNLGTLVKKIGKEMSVSSKHSRRRDLILVTETQAISKTLHRDHLTFAINSEQCRQSVNDPWIYKSQVDTSQSKRH